MLKNKQKTDAKVKFYLTENLFEFIIKYKN